MQLFVLEAMIWLITCFPQTTPIDDPQNCQRVDHPHLPQLGYLKNKKTKNLQEALVAKGALKVKSEWLENL